MEVWWLIHSRWLFLGLVTGQRLLGSASQPAPAYSALWCLNCPLRNSLREGRVPGFSPHVTPVQCSALQSAASRNAHVCILGHQGPRTACAPPLCCGMHSSVFALCMGPAFHIDLCVLSCCVSGCSVRDILSDEIGLSLGFWKRGPVVQFAAGAVQPRTPFSDLTLSPNFPL